MAELTVEAAFRSHCHPRLADPWIRAVLTRALSSSHRTRPANGLQNELLELVTATTEIDRRFQRRIVGERFELE